MSRLNIALVSFEYPLYTGYGGIASYIRDTASMFTAHGHSVTVFCAGSKEEVRQPSELLRECVIDTFDKDDFADLLMPTFRREHARKSFDVVEAAEIYADARSVKREFPTLPLVVKLHTPSFLLERLNHVPISLLTKIRFALGALKRGRLQWLKPDYRILRMREEREAWMYHHADYVTSPSRSLIDLAEAEWGKRHDGNGIQWLPNPYAPPEPMNDHGNHRTTPIGAFFGRLEKRKGFLVIIEALRLLERRGYEMPFYFIGSPHPFPGKDFTMQDWALKRLRKHHLYKFTGHLQRSEATKALRNVDYVVLPSLWENFPYTCLEAMGQQKVVLASAQGGMADMIEDGVDGLLLHNPENARELAERLLFVASKLPTLASVAKAARIKVLSTFAPNEILSAHLAVYHQAIASSSGLKVRSP